MHCKPAHLVAALLLSVAAYAQACSCVGAHRIEFFQYARQQSTLDQQQQKQLSELLGGLNGQRLETVRLTGYAGKNKGNAKLALKRAEQFHDALLASGIPAERIVIDETALPTTAPADFTDGVSVTLGFVPDCSCPSMQ